MYLSVHGWHTIYSQRDVSLRVRFYHASPCDKCRSTCLPALRPLSTPPSPFPLSLWLFSTALLPFPLLYFHFSAFHSPLICPMLVFFLRTFSLPSFARAIHFTHSSPPHTTPLYILPSISLISFTCIIYQLWLVGTPVMCNGRQTGQIAQRHINLLRLTVRTSDRNRCATPNLYLPSVITADTRTLGALCSIHGFFCLPEHTHITRAGLSEFSSCRKFCCLSVAFAVATQMATFVWWLEKILLDKPFVPN